MMEAHSNSSCLSQPRPGHVFIDPPYARGNSALTIIPAAHAASKYSEERMWEWCRTKLKPMPRANASRPA